MTKHAFTPLGEQPDTPDLWELHHAAKARRAKRWAKGGRK